MANITSNSAEKAADAARLRRAVGCVPPQRAQAKLADAARAIVQTSQG